MVKSLKRSAPLLFHYCSSGIVFERKFTLEIGRWCSFPVFALTSSPSSCSSSHPLHKNLLEVFQSHLIIRILEIIERSLAQSLCSLSPSSCRRSPSRSTCRSRGEKKGVSAHSELSPHPQSWVSSLAYMPLAVDLTMLLF